MRRARAACPPRHPVSKWTGRASAVLALVVLDLFELGVDDIVVTPGRRLTASLLSGAVHTLRQPRRSVAQRLQLGLDRRLVVAFDGGLQVRQRSFDLRALFARDLVTQLAQRLLGPVRDAVGLIARLGELTELRV